MKFNRNDKKNNFCEKYIIERIYFSFDLLSDLLFRVSRMINNQLIFQQNQIRSNQNFNHNFYVKFFVCKI